MLLTPEAIQARVREVAAEITADYRGLELTVLAILNGALVFAADLLRHIPLPLQLETIAAASYHGRMETAGAVNFARVPLPSISGRHLLIVDDILDTGLTLHAVAAHFREQAEPPASVKICVLLSKEKRRLEAVTPDYVAFQIPDEFVVGYGLDYELHYRNLPYIGTLSGG